MVLKVGVCRRGAEEHEQDDAVMSLDWQRVQWSAIHT